MRLLRLSLSLRCCCCCCCNRAAIGFALAAAAASCWLSRSAMFCRLEKTSSPMFSVETPKPPRSSPGLPMAAIITLPLRSPLLSRGLGSARLAASIAASRVGKSMQGSSASKVIISSTTAVPSLCRFPPRGCWGAACRILSVSSSSKSIKLAAESIIAALASRSPKATPPFALNCRRWLTIKKPVLRRRRSTDPPFSCPLAGTE
mmetsp:Transcript_31118/g.67004  ORF Transcript_31118/g.67004 Transcript_31118/m.67004 type:complete len:204 (-) Transcript_31118:140-751(-)